MTDRPILFSAPMARALVAGRKTETRRALKPQPPGNARYSGIFYASDEPDSHFFNSPCGPFKVRKRFDEGDVLWVREAWRVSARWDKTKPRDLKAKTMTVFMEAGGSIANQGAGPPLWRPSCWPEPGGMPEWAGRLRAGMFMPWWASRTTLVVKDVRIERLQDITEEGAQAEGIDPANFGNVARLNANLARTSFFRLSYADLWDQINGPGSWDANPWVAVISFKTIFQNIDEVTP